MSKQIELTYIGGGAYINGYPAKDIGVSVQEAKELIKAGIYEFKTPDSKTAKTILAEIEAEKAALEQRAADDGTDGSETNDYTDGSENSLGEREEANS